jgi:hypothetical protein
MDTSARLHHLLTHWVEHNEAHAQTYREWAEKAEEEGLTAASERLLDAIRAVDSANACLRDAKSALPDAEHEHGHHDHDHGHFHGHGHGT